MDKSWLSIPDSELAQSPTLRASYEKLVKNRGVAKVNLPALARREAGYMSCWQADPGRTFVSCDFSSLEPSISAHFSQDPYYRYATYDGIGKLPHFDRFGVLKIDDIYLMTASVMPGVKDTIKEFFEDPANCTLWLSNREAVTGHKLIKPIRSKAKTACLGFGYGMGYRKFQKQAYEAGLIVSLDEAKGMFKAYWGLFQGLRALSDKLQALVKKQGAIVNPMGYRITPEPHKGYNYFIQSTASGVLDLFCLEFFTLCPDAQFIALVHDEAIFSIKSGTEHEALKLKDLAVDKLNKTLGWSVPMRMSFQPAKDFSGIK